MDTKKDWKPTFIPFAKARKRIETIFSQLTDQFLVIITIFEALLAVLAVITGFFGMNIPLPLTQDPNAWIYVSVCSFILWLLLAKVMRWIVKKR